MQKNLKSFFFVILFSVQIFAQADFKFIKNYSEEQGLASNRIYDITQDESGFLWIATDNGVSRFDGRKFHNYSVEQGLPSNDVLQIFRDSGGKIWVNCYMKPPSLFNEKNNRFETDTKNAQFFNKLWVYKYNYDGNYLASYNDTSVQLNEKITINKENNGYLLKGTKNSYIKTYIFDKKNLKLKFIVDGKHLEKDVILGFDAIHTFYFQGSVYCYNKKNELHQFKIDGKTLRVERKFLKIGEKISHFSFSKKFINIITQNGTINVIDGDSLNVILKVKTDKNPNTAYLDRENNLWIGTIDNGLLMYRKTQIRNLNFKNREQQSLLIVGDDIYSGNYFGEAFRNNKRIMDLKNINSSEKNIRINNIIFTQRNNVLVSDHFLIKNFTKFISPLKTELSAIKSSIFVNDKLIFLGTSNGLYRYNPSNDLLIKSGKYNGRILHFLKTNDAYFMATSNEIYQIFPDSDKKILNKNSKYFTNDFITSMEFAEPNLIWVSSEKGNLYLFKNFKLIKTISNKQGLSNNIKCIKANKNTLWIGTHSDGLIRMDYKLDHDDLSYSINYINSFQGLASNTINSIGFKKDSVVVASNNGISIFSDQYKIEPKKNAPIILQAKINGKVVENSFNYHLKKNQHTIAFVISNIDFSNNFPEIQYAINEPYHWMTLRENSLNVEVNESQETVYLRSVSRNKSTIGGVTKILIKKDKYFYQEYWFWLLFGGSVIGLLVFLQGKKIIKKQKFFYEKELERQLLLQNERERISHDMHDDLGAGITAIRFQAKYLKSKIKDEKLSKDVDDLLQTSEEIHKSMRETLWNLNSGKNSMRDFMEYAENYATNFFNKSNIAIHIENVNVNPNILLTPETRRNLFLCMKESLHNIYKHSNAKNANIIFEQVKSNINLIISDDGIGISKKRKDGNGLENMKRRMRDVNGSFTIISQEKGSKLKFSVKV